MKVMPSVAASPNIESPFTVKSVPAVKVVVEAIEPGALRVEGNVKVIAPE